MAKKWKIWEEQSHLKQIIRDQIGDGIQCADLINNILHVCTKRYADWEIKLAVTELLEDWMIIAPVGDSSNDIIDFWLLVTEKAHEDHVTAATKTNSMSDALLFLMKNNVWHPDMDRYGMTEDGTDSVDIVKKAEQENTSKTEVSEKTSMSGDTRVAKIEKAQSGDSTYQEVPEGASQFSSSIQDKLANVFGDNEEEHYEFTIDEIVEKTATIDPKGLAMEIGVWLVKNVEEFIDNQESLFRIYLPICADLEMPNCSLFQRLYISIPDEAELWDALDRKLEEAKTILDEDKEFNKALFKRMSYFYELTGFIVGEGQVKQALTQEMQGSISINELMFDPVMMTTTVSQGVGKNEDGTIKEGDQKVVIKQEDVPAGFALELEICLKPKQSSIPQMY